MKLALSALRKLIREVGETAEFPAFDRHQDMLAHNRPQNVEPALSKEQLLELEQDTGSPQSDFKFSYQDGVAVASCKPTGDEFVYDMKSARWKNRNQPTVKRDEPEPFHAMF